MFFCKAYDISYYLTILLSCYTANEMGSFFLFFPDFIRRSRLRPGLQLPTVKLIELEPSCQARKDTEDQKKSRRRVV